MFAVLAGFQAGPALAADPAPPAPKAALVGPPGTPVVVELFSSQTCPFCPQADRFFNDLANDNQRYIALACHVDYDALNDQFARRFCSHRQDLYMDKLDAGPSYTPQMIINGAREATGYKADDVRQAILEANAQAPVTPLLFTPERSEGSYKVHWRGRDKNAKNASPHIWLVTMMSPQSVLVEYGANRGKHADYTNIANRIQDMGAWPASIPAQILNVPLMPDESGFALLVQDDASGRILAAGELVKQ